MYNFKREIQKKIAADDITLSNYDYTFKVLLLSDNNVEKASFMKRCCYNIFNPSESLTIGVDFHIKTIESHGKKIKLQIWDIGGEERFKFLLPAYCLGANAALLVHDISNPHNLDHVSEWTNNVRQKGGFIPIGLVSLRLHEEIDRNTMHEVILHLIKRFNLNFYVEASAKTGQNIEKIFQILIDIVLEELSVPITGEKLVKKSPCTICDERDFSKICSKDKNHAKKALKISFYELIKKIKRILTFEQK